MKKYSLYIISIPLAVLFLFGFLYWQKNKTVERHGVVYKTSTSGDMRFNYYDIKENKILDSWNEYPWFFATIDNLDDTEKINNFYNYVSENKGKVFRITGIKEDDDCEYFKKDENGEKCLENIRIEKIEVIK